MFNPPISFLPSDRDGDQLLPWVIGVMLFLCAMATAFAISLSKGLDAWTSDTGSHFTVQVSNTESSAQRENATRILKLLEATPGITDAQIAADADVLAILRPWLGDIPLGTDLPIPTLITGRLDGSIDVQLSALAERVKAITPDAKLDDHKAWLGKLLSLAATLKLVLIGVTAMVTLSTIAIVIFGCRAGLATHKESIGIMHLMGAEDHMIASAFDRRYLLYGFLGGVGGILLAALIIFAISNLGASIAGGLITATLPGMEVILWLLPLPILSGLLSMITARITVRQALLAMT